MIFLLYTGADEQVTSYRKQVRVMVWQAGRLSGSHKLSPVQLRTTARSNCFQDHVIVARELSIYTQPPAHTHCCSWSPQVQHQQKDVVRCPCRSLYRCTGMIYSSLARTPKFNYRQRERMWSIKSDNDTCRFWELRSLSISASTITRSSPSFGSVGTVIRRFGYLRVTWVGSRQLPDTIKKRNAKVMYIFYIKVACHFQVSISHKKKDYIFQL